MLFFRWICSYVYLIGYINLVLIIFFFPKILCENDDEVLVTLKEGKLFGEVSN